VLSTPEIALVKRARIAGYMNHVIAAYLDTNQGRIAEVNTGQVGASVPPAEWLPGDFPPLVRRGRPGSGGLGSPNQPGLF
jgi:hypothetical protein